MPESDDPISDFITTRKTTLSKADLAEMDLLMITSLSPDDYIERRGWYYERIYLLINDPGYTGDIEDLDSED